MDASGAETQSTSRLLRKPRAPKPRPPPSPPPQSNDAVHHSNPQYAFYPVSNHNDLHTPTHSVSPPPPTESQSRPNSRVYDRSRVSTQKTQRISRRREDGKYMLDPVFRDKTNLGTYVEGHTMVKPYRPRGPAGLPCREPKRNPPLLASFVYEDEMRYYQPPAFTLHDFTLKLAEKANVPLEKIQTIMFSRHTYKRMQELLVERCMPKHPEVNTIQLELPDDAVHTSPRVPHQQLLVEMAALVKEQMSSAINTDMKSVFRQLPRYSPDYKPDGRHPHTEILLYEDHTRDQNSRQQQYAQDTELPSQDGFFQGPTRHFQGSRRSHSPFMTADEAFISPSELAVLDAIMSSGQALSLKANFISQMPDIEPLSKTITYLNISFNDFKYIPLEVFDISQLTVLKLRNNPITDISPHIGRLKKLRTLVFSFCLVSSIPVQMFELVDLEQLDMAYNRINYLPPDIRALTNLRELNVEGNQLPALPAGALKLFRLKYVRVRNNFMHPLFWKENSTNLPQRLMDMSALVVKKNNLETRYSNLPDHISVFLKRHLTCDVCRGALYGQGLCAIQPVSKIYGIKNVPFMFQCCSSDCIDLLGNNNEALSEILYGANK